MTQTFEDINGADAIVDDILIWGKDVVEHNKRLEQVLQKARHTNLKEIEGPWVEILSRSPSLSPLLTYCG